MDIAIYYRRGGKQSGENITRERGEIAVKHDGKTWIYEKPPHTLREIKAAIRTAFSYYGRNPGKLSGKYPFYSWETE